MIRIDSVTRIYGRGASSAVALDNVSLEVTGGEFVAVAGPSGSGKTSLLNLIGAIDHPTSGRIRIGEDDLSGLGDDARAELRLRRVCRWSHVC